jgi:hypothetical protein
MPGGQSAVRMNDRHSFPVGGLVVALHSNRFFRTFGAASNKKFRTNICQSTTWRLFRKAERFFA